jgi:hypothetical protein
MKRMITLGRRVGQTEHRTLADLNPRHPKAHHDSFSSKCALECSLKVTKNIHFNTPLRGTKWHEYPRVSVEYPFRKAKETPA